MGVHRSHVAIHNWVHKADLQPVSTITADQLAVDDKVIRINGNDYWLYAAVGPESNYIFYFKVLTTTTNQTTLWFLTKLHRRYQLDGVEFLVDDADYLVNVLDEDGYRFQMTPHGNRNALEYVY